MLFVFTVSYAQNGYSNDSIHNVAVIHQNNIRYLTQFMNRVSFDEYPLNDYSGLNSLKERLSTFTDERLFSLMRDSNSDKYKQLETRDSDDYGMNGTNQNHCFDVPILFFFKIGTTILTDFSQLANLDKIAETCKKYNLSLKIAGYADSATGDATRNTILSNKRSEYIASELSQRGISLLNIRKEGKGETNIYSPASANRCVSIEIAPTSVLTIVPSKAKP